MRIVFVMLHEVSDREEKAIVDYANELNEIGEDVHIVNMYDNLKRTISLRSFSAEIIIPVYPSFHQLIGIQLAVLFSKTKVLYLLRNDLQKKHLGKKDKLKWRIQSFLADGIWVQDDEQREYFPDYMQEKIFEARNIPAEQLLWHLKRICNVHTNLERAFEVRQYFIKSLAKVLDFFMIYIFPLPDWIILKWLYKKRVGRNLDLRDPKNLTEKLQWLKLYDRRKEYIKLADKYEVKRIVAKLVGEEHVIPVLGIWEHFDDIDFTALPDQFVLKCTHDSGSIVVCMDKSVFDVQMARKKLEQHLKHNYYRQSREWPYKHVKPRIIAESYLDSLGKKDSMEYKVSCFNGRVGFIIICTGISHARLRDRTNDHFDCDFNKIPFWTEYKNSEVTLEKPREWEELIELSEKLSAGIPYVRVDWYPHHGKLYFGEMTFYPTAGFMKFKPEKYDRIWGDMLTLPKKKRRGR